MGYSKTFFIPEAKGLLKKLCTVHVCVTRVCVNAYAIGCGVLWGTCNNRTMVPHKEIQWHNGTPQEKFYSLATFGHNREECVCV